MKSIKSYQKSLPRNFYKSRKENENGLTSIWPLDVKRKTSPLDREERNKTDTIRLKSY